jgi:hypothetical protein
LSAGDSNLGVLRGVGGYADDIELFVFQLLGWLPWALATPWVMRLSVRAPLRLRPEPLRVVAWNAQRCREPARAAEQEERVVNLRVVGRARRALEPVSIPREVVRGGELVTIGSVEVRKRLLE